MEIKMLRTWEVGLLHRRAFNNLLEQGLEMLMTVPVGLKSWKDLYGSQAVSSLILTGCYQYPCSGYSKDEKGEIIELRKREMEKKYCSLKKAWEKFCVEVKIECRDDLIYVVFTAKEHL